MSLPWLLCVVGNDPLGRPANVTNALGQVESHSYDAVNRLSTTDRNGQRDSFTYDGLNRLLTTAESDTNGVVRTRTAMVYRDPLRQQLSIDRRGLTNVAHLDALGRVIRTERSGGDTASRYGTSPSRRCGKPSSR